jgi:hypothetical protein
VLCCTTPSDLQQQRENAPGCDMLMLAAVYTLCGRVLLLHPLLAVCVVTLVALPAAVALVQGRTPLRQGAGQAAMRKRPVPAAATPAAAAKSAKVKVAGTPCLGNFPFPRVDPQVHD